MRLAAKSGLAPVRYVSLSTRLRATLIKDLALFDLLFLSVFFFLFFFFFPFPSHSAFLFLVYSGNPAPMTSYNL